MGTPHLADSEPPEPFLPEAAWEPSAPESTMRGTCHDFRKFRSSFCFCSLRNSSYVALKNGEGNGTPLQYSCLENTVDGGAWWAAVLGVVKSQTRLSDFTFTFHFHALEKEMATHSSVLAWRIPGTAEPGGLPSMGSQSWTRLKRLSSSSSSPQKAKVLYFLCLGRQNPSFLSFHQ